MNRENASTFTLGSMAGSIILLLLQTIYAVVMAPVPAPIPTPDVVIVDPVPTPVEYLYSYVERDGSVVDAPQVIAVADQPTGSYRVTRVPRSGIKLESVITIGGQPVPPTPKPDPPKPEPPKPPEVGKRTVVILRETSGTSLKTQSLLIGLRTGSAAKYLTDKSHKLYVVDMDAVNEKDTPSEIVNSWKAEIAGMKLPVIVIAESLGDGVKPIAKRELKDTETPDNVIEFLRQNGG